VLCEDREVADYFEKAAEGVTAKTVANWITSELFGLLNKEGIDLKDCKIKSEHIRELVALIDNGTISGKIAKTVFEEMFTSGDKPEKIVADKGLVQVSDIGAIKAVVAEVLAENQDSVEKYKAGADRLFGFFVGQVMKKMGGKANPGVVNDLLKELLG